VRISPDYNGSLLWANGDGDLVVDRHPDHWRCSLKDGQVDTVGGDLQPRHLEYHRGAALTTATRRITMVQEQASRGVNMAMADGSVRFISRLSTSASSMLWAREPAVRSSAPTSIEFPVLILGEWRPRAMTGRGSSGGRVRRIPRQPRRVEFDVVHD